MTRSQLHHRSILQARWLSFKCYLLGMSPTNNNLIKLAEQFAVPLSIKLKTKGM